MYLSPPPPPPKAVEERQKATTTSAKLFVCTIYTYLEPPNSHKKGKKNGEKNGEAPGWKGKGGKIGRTLFLLMG